MCGNFLIFYFPTSCLRVSFFLLFFLDLEKYEIKFITIRVVFFVFFGPLSPFFYRPSLRLDFGPCGEFVTRVHGCTFQIPYNRIQFMGYLYRERE